MNQFRLLAAAFALSATVSVMNGCSTREQTGQVIGGAVGAAAGNQVGGGTGRTVATIGGAVLGALIGGAIGENMDDGDRQRTVTALENSRTGQTTAWVNPDTGYRYQIQPTNTYDADDRPCREYTMEAEIDGRNETIQGTACRQEDGTWR